MQKKVLRTLSLLFLLIISRDLRAEDNSHLISGDVYRASVSSAAIEANGSNEAVGLSADGRYIVFKSSATNLVPNDTNHVPDIFLHDRETGITELISVDSSELQANAESYDPVVSVDGRYVAFHSFATNLVASDDNGCLDVFVRDRVAGTTKRVSVDTLGGQGNGHSTHASISDDGNLITFMSEATNLVGDDTNGVSDIFIHNISLGTTTRLSPGAVEVDAESYDAMISGNGQFVVFASKATNLVAGDSNGCADIFVYEISSGNTELVSVHSNGTKSERMSSQPVITNDGQLVAFASSAGDLVDNDSNGYQDIFLHSRVNGSTELVSLDASGNQIMMPSSSPGVSLDGRFITFSSLNPNVVSGDSNGQTDVFMRDRNLSTTKLISADNTGTLGDKKSSQAVITSYGSFIAFQSISTNLVTGDTNNRSDIFVKTNLDAVSIVDISVSVTQVDEELDANFEFTLHRVQGVDQEITVYLDASGGTAIEGVDFNLPGLVIFPSGEDTVVVSVELLNDIEIEETETIGVSIVPNANYSILPSGESISVDVTDTDKFVINVDTKIQVIHEVGGPLVEFTEVTFSRVGGSSGDVTVHFTVSGTATPGSDYYTLPNSVLIPNGEESVKLTVQAKDDQEDEPYELIRIDLDSDPNYTVGDSSSTVIAIKDNERIAPPFEMVRHLYGL